MIGSTVYIPSAPNDDEKLKYININIPFYKLLLVINLATWVLFFYNYYQFFSANWILLSIFGPLVTFIVIYQVISIIINLFLPKFNHSKHELLVNQFWSQQSKKKPTIDIFLPVCGEDIRILRNTWEGVYSLNSNIYKINPVVLDDSGSEKVKELASEFGFKYLSRPNRGELKKAGNLKFGFQQTSSDFILILDADFKPRSDFIYEALPYMSDPKIGIVQTPQYFDNDKKSYKFSPLMSGAASIQEYFYKIIQPSRGVLGGAICVGTCALYRREALSVIGGTYQIEHSEDVYTGFALKANGYDLKYLPIILSKGVCPDDIHSFFKQQTRWCLGSMTLMLNKDFWKVKIPFYTRLCFISGFAFYISNLVGLFLTFHTLITLYFFRDKYSNDFPVVFIILLLNSLLVQILYVYKKPNFGTILAHGAASWSYIFTLLSLFIGHKEGWTPTGAKSKISNGLITTYQLLSAYTIITIGAFVYMYYNDHINFNKIGIYSIIVWFIAQCIYCINFWSFITDYLNLKYFPTLRSLIMKILYAGQKIILGFLIFSLLFMITDDISNKQLSTRLNQQISNSNDKSQTSINIIE